MALLLLCWLIGFATTVRAHATLLHTEPEANADLGQPPKSVTLLFNERVEPVFNSLRVSDAHGNRVSEDHIKMVDDGEGIAVDLLPLADGPYSVFWRVTSADGHQVQGIFGFGVRAAPPDEKSPLVPENQEETSFMLWFRRAVKWLDLTAMVFWLGGIAYLLWVYLPTVGQQENAEWASPVWRALTALIWCSAVTFFIAECLSLIGQAAATADVPVREAVSSSVMKVLLTSTNYGIWWSVRVTCAALLLAICPTKLRPTEWKPGARGAFNTTWTAGFVVLASLILLSFPLSGHASTVSQWPAIAVGMDWLHLAASTVWIGGLAALTLTVLILRSRKLEKLPELLNPVAARFSSMARTCVIALLATGIYGAWLHMPSLLSFLTTNYGRVLLAKIFVFLAILVLAALNWRRVLPALAIRNSNPRSENWARRFAGFLKSEVALGFVVLALVAVLTSLPPASTVIAAGPVELSHKSGDVVVHLRMESSRVGQSEAVVTLTDEKGENISRVKRVTLYLRSEEMDMGLQTVEAVPSANGSYRADVSLTMAGRWTINVQVSPAEGDDFVTEFQLSSNR